MLAVDVPFPGDIYHDRNFEFSNGQSSPHYFVIGPDDKVLPEKVIVFACTSQAWGRPATTGCHVNHELASYHLTAGTIDRLPKPTWIQLDEFFYRDRVDFQTKWKKKTDSLPLNLSIHLFECASQSSWASRIDRQACAELHATLSQYHA